MVKAEYKVVRWGGMAAERLEKILNELGADHWAIVYCNDNMIILGRLAETPP